MIVDGVRAVKMVPRSLHCVPQNARHSGRDDRKSVPQNARHSGPSCGGQAG
jgi:hypothetical protein